MSDWASIAGIPLWGWLFVLPLLIALACFFVPLHARQFLRPLWAGLDRIYGLFGAISGVFMVIILLLIVAQMTARWSGISFPGSTNFAGYAMASASFLALGYAFTKGAHIRVSILLNANNFTRFWVDAYAMAIGAVIATYFARFAVKTTILSEMINDRTQGQDKVPETLLTLVEMFGTWPWNWGALWAESGSDWVFTPIWLPQIPMSIGTIVLAIALWDHLYRLIITGKTHIIGEAVE